VIATNEALGEWLPCLDTADWIAIDTEADSLHAYPEKLCLLQLTANAGDFLIDPLSPALDLAPLWSELAGRELILHGADYDLRLLKKDFNFSPSVVFDTMIAARLLGVEKFGLSNLVEQFLDVSLEKGPQKANWALRPLTPRMEEYARNDTRYLKPLSDLLRSQLEAKGRLSWHAEVCARLISECSILHTPDPDQLWRIKGNAKLERRGLAVLREVCQWREREAIVANRPLFFIMSPQRVVALSAAAAEAQPLEEFISHRYSPRRREQLDQAIKQGLAVPENQLPLHIRQKGVRMTALQKQKVVDIQALRDRHATELEIDPTLIASRATMTALAIDWDKAFETLMNWQKEILG
jgi:ribonuclease D